MQSKIIQLKGTFFKERKKKKRKKNYYIYVNYQYKIIDNQYFNFINAF